MERAARRHPRTSWPRDVDGTSLGKGTRGTTSKHSTTHQSHKRARLHLPLLESGWRPGSAAASSHPIALAYVPHSLPSGQGVRLVCVIVSGGVASIQRCSGRRNDNLNAAFNESVSAQTRYTNSPMPRRQAKPVALCRPVERTLVSRPVERQVVPEGGTGGRCDSAATSI